MTFSATSPRATRGGQAFRLAVLTLVIVDLAAALVGMRLGALQLSGLGRVTTRPVLQRIRPSPRLTARPA